MQIWICLHCSSTLKLRIEERQKNYVQLSVADNIFKKKTSYHHFLQEMPFNFAITEICV